MKRIVLTPEQAALVLILLVLFLVFWFKLIQ